MTLVSSGVKQSMKLVHDGSAASRPASSSQKPFSEQRRKAFSANGSKVSSVQVSCRSLRNIELARETFHDLNRKKKVRVSCLLAIANYTLEKILHPTGPKSSPGD